MDVINRRGIFLVLFSLIFIPNVYAYYDHVVISEVQISGGTAGDEFIELYNPTSSIIDLTGWKLKKNSSGTESNLVSSFPAITIPAYGYILITNQTGYDGIVGADLNYSGSSYYISNDNAILLYNNSDNLIDKVGYGSSSDYEGTVFPTNPTADQSIERRSSSIIHYEEKGNGWDTDNNSDDFFILTTPNPQNSLSSPENAQNPWWDEINVIWSIEEDKTSQVIFLNATETNASKFYYDLQDGNTWNSINVSTDTGNVNCSDINEEIRCDTFNNYTGIFIITLDAKDEENNSAIVSFNVNISDQNDPPWIYGLGLDNVNINEDTGANILIYTNQQLKDNFGDVENDRNPDTISLDYYSQNISVINCYIPSGPLGDLRCTTVANQSGYSDITIQYLDNGGNPITDTIRINVTSVNDPPWSELISDPDAINEDSGVNQDVINITTLNNAFRDVEDSSLTNCTIALETNTSVVDCDLDSSYNVDCETKSNQSGSSIVTLNCCDSGNGCTDMDNFTIIVNDVNDAPWKKGDLSNASYNEDTGTFIAITNSDLNANWTDLEQQTPSTYELITSTNSSTSCYFDASNNWDCNTLADQTGTDYYTISLNDSSGASVIYDWQITINAVNDKPWLTDVFSNITLDEDTGTFIAITNLDLNANWTDLEQSTPSTYELISQSNTSAVSCLFVTNNLQCTTVANQSGVNSIKFSLNDSSGAGIETDFLVTINPVNDKPWVEGLADVNISEDSDTNMIYTNQELKNNFRDLEEDYNPNGTEIIDESNISVVDCGIDSSGNLTCLTQANQTGYSNITIRYNDSEGLTENDVFRINVNNVNDDPSAPNLISPENNTKITEKTVLLNWNESSDIDNDEINYHVYISNNSDNIIYYNTTNNTEINYDVENNKNYYWYVKADDSKINVSSLTNMFITDFPDAPVIDTYYPTEPNLVIQGNEIQEFNISVSDPDGTTPGIKWYLDNELIIENSTSYTKNFNARDSPYNVSVLVYDGGEIWKEWSLTATNKPFLGNEWDGNTTNFSELSEEQLNNLENVIFEDSDKGKIEFLENLNLSGFIDISDNIKINNGIVAVNSNNYPELNKKARITLRNLYYKTIPKIYYYDGFSINGGDITKECDFCKLISYDNFPTSNGKVVFDVSHFSSFKVGESGDRYNLTDFTELDKCESGRKGSLSISIKDPDNNDDFNFGENIDINVNVKNNNQDDKDVIVETFLYNIDEDDEEENVEADSIDISKNDKEDFELQIKIPEDYDNKDNYILFVKAYEDGNENEQCNYDIIDLNLERESHDVIIKELELIPKEADCNGNVQANVKVQNTGTKDEKDLYVKLENSELNISLESDKFDLDDYKGGDEKITKRFNFRIPENIQSKDYNLDASVYFSDGSYVKSEILKVKSCEEEIKKENLVLFGETSVSKGIANVHLIITNNNEDIIGDIKMNPIGNWAEAIAPQAVSLHNGENNIYLNTKIKEGITGKYSSLVELNIRNGETKKINLVFDIQEEVKEVKEEVKEEYIYRGFLFTIVKFVEERLK